ncbi:MAG: alpha/beta hydrolase [Victivallales bacterium]|nr:alpha/beta hydrolase [Victivallales bacterium]
MEKIMLWPDGAKALADNSGDDFLPYMTFYPSQEALPEAGRGRPAMVIFPGGAYVMRAPHEGGDIAERFVQFGFSCFVVEYRVAPHAFPGPQQDAFRAIQLIRANAERFGIDPEQISTIGFSAGGHLSACTATLFDDENVDSSAGDAADAFCRRPNAVGLSYPVITSNAFTHVGSMQNLQGKLYPHLNQRLSLELRVTDNTPPTFIWTTANDQAVPVQNSILFMESMLSHKLPVELHIFPDGVHGLGLANDHADIAQWPALYAKFLRSTVSFNCKG